MAQQTRSYNSVVKFCGNNELSAHATKALLRLELPEIVAENSTSLQRNLDLDDQNVRCGSRPDNSSQDVRAVNRIIRENNTSITYISSGDIRDNSHFRTHHTSHLEMDLGVYDAKRRFAGLTRRIL